MIRRRLTLAGLAGLAGCSVLPQPKYVQQTQWPLGVRRPRQEPPRRGGKVLLVTDLGAAPGLDRVGLQWLEPNGTLHVDFYNQWAVPPAQGVTEDLRQWLQASGLFAAVLGQGSVGVVPDLTLQGQLSRFWAQLNTKTALATIDITLLNSRASPSKVLLQRSVPAEAPMPSDNVQGVANGLKAALAGVLTKIEQILAAR